MNDPVALLSIRVHVRNLALVSVVFNPTWRLRVLVKSGGELAMTKHQGTRRFSQVGRGGYAFGVGGGCAVGGGGMALIN